MITQDKKQEIAAEAKKYMTEADLSIEDMSELSGVNKSYLQQILQGKTVYYNGAEISEIHFVRLSQVLDVDLDSTYWKKRNTPQFMEMFYRLKTAKEMPIRGMIIGETGCGKTFTLSRFRKMYPKKTYVVTLTGQHRVADVLKDVCRVIRADYKTSNTACIRSIAHRINNVADMSNIVLIAFDEAENATVGVLRAVKSIYDAVKGYCSIVMVGTPQLLSRLDMLEKKNSTGIPQFCSRFRSGIVHLEPIEKIDAETKEYRTFDEFFADDIADLSLQALLRELCKDYRMLNEYLVPAKKKAEEMGRKLDCELFKTLYKITV
jgi:Helix-turn-helix.